MAESSQIVGFGLCMPRPAEDVASVLVAAGCDYYEPTVAGAVMADDTATFQAELSSWDVAGLKPRAANVLFPPDIKVVGPDADPIRIATYVTEAMGRVRRLGIEVIVFGSGGSRRVPDGFSPMEAHRQLENALALVAETAGPGVMVCLEHLRRAETNLVNSLAQAGDIVDGLQLPNLGLVVDAYHLQEEDEPPSVLRRFPRRAAHVHMCGPNRNPPGDGDIVRLAAVFEELGLAGYRGRASVECRFTDIAAEGPAALEVLRRAATLAGLPYAGAPPETERD